MLLAGDLVGQWVADELVTLADDASNTVTGWTDSQASAEATSTGHPVLVEGGLNGRNVIRFDASDGVDGFRVRAVNNPLSNADDFSVSVVFSTDATNLVGDSGDWYTNTSLVDSNRQAFGKDWGLTINAEGQLVAGMSAGDFGATPRAHVRSTDTGWNDGNFHLVTLTRSGSNLSLYVDDGTAVTMDAAPATTRDAIDLTIGMLQQGSNNGFTGDIAEVRLFNGALDASEVQSLYGVTQAYYNNAPPTASPDSFTFTEDPTFGFHLVGDANGVLLNDVDVEGDPISAHLVSGPASGNVVLNPGGGFTYDPVPDFAGTDSFTYTANDIQASEPVTVTLNVTNVYDAPRPVDDNFAMEPTETLVIPGLVGLIANDGNPDNNPLQSVLDVDVNQGSLTLGTDGGFRFDPQGQAGVVTFTYRLDDQTGNGLSDPATVTIVVNTPPIATPDTIDVTEDAELDVVAAVLANDVDADGDVMNVTITESPTNGVLLFGDDGGVTYTPNENFVGTDQLSYQLDDGTDSSPIVVATFNVTPVNDVPVGAGDVYYTDTDQALTVGVANSVLANDRDVEGSVLTATLQQSPSHGNLTLRADGSFSYTPNAGYTGNDQFTYLASDGEAETAPITVTLLVGNPPVRINEVMAANATVIETSTVATPGDRFPREKDTPDWIELKNLTSTELSIGGYFLSDDEDEPQKWRVPDGTTIPADGYLVVYADRLSIDDPGRDETGRLHTNFKVNTAGEYVSIAAPTGSVIDALADYGEQRPDIAYGYDAAGTLGYLKSPTPEADNDDSRFAGIVDEPVIDVDRGFYETAFDVTITAGEGGGTIRYTLDGSQPTATHGEIYSAPINITTTTVLKAVAVRDNYIPSTVKARSYIFGADVLQQDNSGMPGATDNWGHRGPDYEMDPEVVNHEDPEIRPEVEDLKRIPTVSVAIDTDLFLGVRDGTRGIYVFGENVEQPITFEYFDPQATDNGVQTNSTIQIVGGSSPQRWKSDKLSMRVRFTEDAGESDLDYPLFGAEANTSFDTLVLDARLNNVWHYGGGSSPNTQRNIAQYMRDEFAADLQNEVGGYATHGQHIHLYINGIYWGMHTLHERPDENFQAAYQGGVSEDFNVIKHTMNEVINGDNQSYLDIVETLGRNGELSDAQYEAAKATIDLEDLINYMLVNYYGGNEDWDHHNWYASQNPNDGLWRFHSWDAEKVLQSVNSNKTRTNNHGAPSGLHLRLMEHPEYLLKFQDAVQKHFYNGGAMTPEAAAELYRHRSDQIDLVMRVESARWGDNQEDNGERKTYTRPDWVATRDGLFNNYFPRRTEVVIGQFGSRDWFTEGQAPVFHVDGTEQHGGYAGTGSVSMTGIEGTIYYTLDGSDPRVEGGAVADGATLYGAAFSLSESSTLTARIQFADGTWGPMSQADFMTTLPADATNLRVTEVNYHPADATDAEIAAGVTDADSFEFVELMNISDTSINLANVRFVQTIEDEEVTGLAFDFADSDHVDLGPGERIVVVEDLEAFAIRYGNAMTPAGQWSGGLSNSSERLLVMAGEDVILDVTYSDAWHATTDGDGPTLQAANEAGEIAALSAASGWRPSTSPLGSPGAADGETVRRAGDVNGDGIFNSQDLVLVFAAGKYEDDIPNNATFEEGDWDGDGDFTTADLVAALQLGYTNSAVPRSFAFDPKEATLWVDDALRTKRDDDLSVDADSLDALLAEDDLKPGLRSAWMP